MDHQHFENYLLNDTPIPREEKSAFDAHLKICASCAALAEVNRSLKNVVMAAPSPGFATRFQVRLAAQRKVQRRRHLFGLLILLFSGIGVGVWYALPFISTFFLSPVALLTAWAQTLSSTISLLETLVNAMNVIGRVATGFIAPESFALVLGTLSLLIFGWMISLQKASLPQVA
jgi:hypothetical protein